MMNMQVNTNITEQRMASICDSISPRPSSSF